MNDFKRNIFKTSESQVIILDPFDYMIVTYQYDNSLSSRDLDSATCFQNTGTNQDNLFVGCGQNGSYITPTNSNTINNAYLYQAGDDVGNGLGESIVINFKSLKTAGISLNDDVRVELYAGWCQPPISMKASVSVTTYLGGVMTITNNVITSNGTIVSPSPFTSENFPVVNGCCSVNPITSKTHVGTIYYNLETKISNVIFY